MRLIIICGMILTLAVAAANGQNSADQAREAICKKVACRDATVVKVRVSDKEFAAFDFPRGPFVADGFINVLSGENFSVEFEEQNGHLINPRFVKENIHPDNTVSFSLSHSQEGSVLKVSNPFPKAIVYDCMIQHYLKSGVGPTTVTPVPAKLKSFELWPYAVPQVLISNVHFQPASGGISSGDIPPGPKARILSKPPPEMPSGISPQPEITIVLRAVFTKESVVTSINFFKVTPEDTPKEMVTLLTERAIAAAKKIKFVPATRDGRPVSMYMQLEYNFNFPDDQPKLAAPATKNSKPKDLIPGI